MTSSGTSPKRKRMNLKLKAKVRNEDDDGPNTHLVDSTNAQMEPRTQNFMKACLNVSYEAYNDIKKRFQLIYLPPCINNKCNHGDKNANLKPISRSAEQSFKTAIKSNTWYEALEICLVSITSCQYLSANVLKDIIEIMMNAHEDLDSGYPIDYLLRKCQHTLMINFNMHPPCFTNSIRDCYKEFLSSPMNQKKFSNRKMYLSDEGIISHCFSRLTYEISVDSNDGTFLEEQEIPTEIEGVKRLHWKKENLELFEFLPRTDRIERCMLILESTVNLLQTDIALWHARYISTGNQNRSQKPLLAHLLWRNDFNTFGKVTPLCQKIMQLYAYYIHLRYPERHIKTLGLWINTVIQMFYIYNEYYGVNYPNIRSNFGIIPKEFNKIISPLPNTSILRILEKIQPSFMQYLVGIHCIKTWLDFTQNDIISMMISWIDNMSWKDYPPGDGEVQVNKKSKLKPYKLFEYLSRRCRTFNVTNDAPTNVYPKLQLQKNDDQTQLDCIIDILFRTFTAYLETYSIKNFNQILEMYNNNEINCDLTSYKSYTVNDEFVKLYRSIIKSLQELLVKLKEKPDGIYTKKISDLLKDYFS